MYNIIRLQSLSFHFINIKIFKILKLIFEHCELKDGIREA